MSQQWKDIILKFLGFIFLLGLASWVYYPPNLKEWASHGFSATITSTTVGPPSYTLNVLFIGNSFTYVHDIPRQVADIASSDPGNTIQLFIQSVTRGSADLQMLWDDGKALEAIRGNRWDYVVLQEQSGWAMYEPFVQRAYTYFAKFDDVIHQSEAKTLIYLTWIDKPGSHWYTDPAYSYLGTPDSMHKHLVSNSYAMAEKLSASVVPVGTYWRMALEQQPNIELYESEDGHHQGIAGAYLSALVFYKTLTSRDITKITYRPDGVSAEEADKLKAIVAEPLPAP